jgi:adenylyltransferase/sulfurtransferase
LDGFDRISARYAINRACAKLGVPYIFGAALEMYGNVSTIIPGKTSCLECIFPGLDDRILPTCSTVGVHPSILTIIASLQVSEAVYLVLGSPNLAGKLLYIDLENLTIVDVNVSKVDNCSVCDGNVKEEKVDAGLMVEEVCGRMGLPTYIVTPSSTMNLEIHNVRRTLEGFGAKIVAHGRLGITFSLKGFNVSLLKSGVMVVVGARSASEAKELYEELSKSFKV